jgi:hypothetical protein
MKRHIPLASIILIGVLSAGASAQAASAQKLVASIPFTFSVGKANLPAGRYTITVLNTASDRKILRIRSMDGRSSVVIFTTGVTGNVSDGAKLVFHRYGDRYFFAQAQMAGDPTSLAAIKSKAERAEIQAIARAGKKSMVVMIAAE